MVLTTQTKLLCEDTDAFEADIAPWNQIFRHVWYRMKDPSYKRSDDAALKHQLIVTYQIKARVANAIMNNVAGRLKALKEAKKTELKQKKQRVAELEKQVKTLSKKLDKWKQKAVKNELDADKLADYRKMKASLYYKRNRLNKARQEYNTREKRIDEKDYRLSFGGNAFRKYNEGVISKEEYIKKRDCFLFYLGSSDETCGNVLFQGTFTEEGCSAYVSGIHQNSEWHSFRFEVPFRKEVLINYHGPLSYRVVRKKTGWYLNISYQVEYAPFTTERYGVIGLDFNKGFIEATETDESGNIKSQRHYDYKNATQVQEAVSKIVRWAADLGKNVGAESLDFKNTKAKSIKASSKKDKKYNHMIHTLPYAEYTKALKSASARYHVTVDFVNPKNSSKHAVKYESRKLNRHQGASLIIARRAQGLSD